MILQKNQLLFRFLKLRVIVNGKTIYALIKNRPVVIEMPTNPTSVVVTDGYHITKPLQLSYSPKKILSFKIACVIEDDQLIVALIIMALLYAMGSTSGILILQLISVIPLFYFLFLYYINRKDFIQIQPA